jgi:hypothetical protein
VQQPSNEPIAAPTNPPIPLKELAAILIKHYGFHEGFYEVGIQFNIAVGSVGPDPSQAAPGAVLTVGGIGLSKCLESSPLGVNASIVNPAVVAAAKKPARKKVSNK